MEGNSALAHVLQRVRRRALTQLFLEHGNLALIVALAALILLIILGTQVMHWVFPLLLLLLFLAVGWLRLRKSIPTDYEIAQSVDARLGLQDSLSTAYYFSSADSNKNPHPAVVEAQRRQAEAAAGSADPIAAAPVFLPRSVWATAGLLAVSLALLIARYGLRGNLDLSQPLVHIPFDSFLSQPDVVAKREPLPKQKLPPGAENIAVPTDLQDQQTGEKKEAMEPPDGPKAQTIEAGEAAGKDAKQSKDGQESNEPGAKEQGEANEKGEGKAGAEDQAQQAGGNSNSPGKQNAKQQQGGNPNNAQQQQSDSSLMDKMKDAMANMLSRMRMSPNAQEGAQKNQASNQGSPQSSAGKKEGKKGAPTQGKGEGEQSSDQEGEQQGEGASKNMQASNRTDGASDKQAPQEGKSGAGKQDGEKDIKAAEQAAAISKISELLGKRAKDLTGEVMVEVSSGRQQLKTQMSQRNSTHGDSGGDVNRDEVPAAYQQFVQQYFEQLRKPGAAAPATPPATPPAPKNP